MLNSAYLILTVEVLEEACILSEMFLSFVYVVNGINFFFFQLFKPLALSTFILSLET